VIVGVLVPGVGYTTQGPLLSFAGVALSRRGIDAHHVSWQLPSGLDRAGQLRFVIDQVSAALDTVAAQAPGATPVIVAKSIGTLAAPLAAERGLPAIWLTPLVKLDFVADAIRRSTAPALLVGGTADSLWDGAVARDTGRQVLEVPDADHVMYVPGPLRESARVLGEIATAIEEFLDALPGASG